MNPEKNGAAHFDGGLFSINRNNFPPEELAKFAGQHVAWSMDGTRILASGPDMEEVEKQLILTGIDPSQVVGSYVEALDEPSLLPSIRCASAVTFCRPF